MQNIKNIIYLLLLITSPIWGQNFHFDTFDRSKNLFYKNAYSNSIASFRFSKEFDQNKFTKEYLMLLSSLRNNRPGADKQLPFFIEQNPLNYLGIKLPFDLANFYFDNQKYSYALKWYKNIDADLLSSPLRNKFNFNKGYSLFNVKRYRSAKSFLEKVKSIPKYESDAYYYLGHISYQLDDYESAQTEFIMSNKESKQNDLAYFKVDMNFNLGRFQKAVDLGVDLIEDQNKLDQSELSKVIGESYFNLKEYDKALVYLKNYKGKNGKWSNDDLYQLGYAYYSSGSYLRAINQFNKIINNSNLLSQNAYYLLGDSYLKVNKKIEALAAFKKASEMNFDSRITEDALLQYSKLGYESGNPFESSQKVMIRFLNLFPKNKHVKDLESILVSSYTEKGNYDAALLILESGVDYKDNEVLQQVQYLKGLSLFESADYSSAQMLFSKAVKINEIDNITAKSLYWMGQSLYQLGLFSAAKKSYDNYYKITSQNNLKLNENFWYEIGYTYFKLEDYSIAIECFKKQINLKKDLKKSYLLDTYLRLADSYFANSDYWAALENYNISINLSNFSDHYPKFQKSLSYGFLQKFDNKINVLVDLTKEDQKHFLVDKALYELAKTYALIKKYKIALNTYDQLISRFPKSSYISRSYLNKGLILFNNEELEESQLILKNMIEKYKNDRITSQALITLKEISIELGDVDVFSDWLKEQNIDLFTDGDLANLAFESAEKYYFEKKNRQAKRQIKDFLIRYPGYSDITTLRFYLADINFQNKDWNDAMISYNDILNLPNNEYTERSLVNSILAVQNLNQPEKLISLLIRLEKNALYEENKRFARYNLLRSYNIFKRYNKAISLAEDILKEDKLDINIRWDALEISARSSLVLKDSSSAFKKFKKLENSPKKLIAVEARYYKAYQLSEAGNYDLSNNVIAEISKLYGNSQIWSAKSILLMADNFKNLNDYFQSTYLLETLLDNFDEYSEINIEAKELLIEVKKRNSEKNSSVEFNNSDNE